MFGSCATGHLEPCQVRKEAALKGSFRVTEGSLGGVNCSSIAWKIYSRPGARHYNLLNKQVANLYFLYGFLWVLREGKRYNRRNNYYHKADRTGSMIVGGKLGGIFSFVSGMETPEVSRSGGAGADGYCSKEFGA